MPDVCCWVLLVFLHGKPELAGEYQTHQMCLRAAAMQQPWWSHRHGRRVFYKCSRS